MDRIIIGVTLLPSPEVMEKAIELNRTELVAKGHDKTVLHKENCVPHISLYIGCIESKNLPKIKSYLEKIADEYNSLQLNIDGVDIVTMPNGERVSGLRVIKTPQIQLLHEMVMQAMMPFRIEEYGKEAVYSLPSVEDITITLINRYLQTAYKNFDPHITIGIGEVNTTKVKVGFKSSRLAMFHCGNYCTCRKLLFSKELKD